MLSEGLGLLPPALFGSTQTLAIVRWPAGSDNQKLLFGQALGADLVLNADMMQDAEMPLTILHEITHNFTDLSNAVTRNDPDSLPA